MDIAAWLKQLELEQYAGAFRANDIDDATLLAALTSEDLRELGVTSLGHRKKLLAAIEVLVDSADKPSAPRRSATSLVCPPGSAKRSSQAEGGS